MFVAFVENENIIFTSDEGETFEEFVQKIVEGELPFYDFSLASLEFAVTIPTEISIKRKDD
jgi:hypothetical protein